MNSFPSLEVQLAPPTATAAPALAEDAQSQELARWVARMATHDQAALSALYDACVQRVYGLVRRYVHEEGVAQEVVQDVFMQVWQQANRFDATRGNAMAWLLTIARSRALDAWRKLAASPVLTDSDAAELAAEHWRCNAQPVDLIDAMDTRCILHAALAELPANARQMLTLAFFQDLTHAQISAQLHLPLGTVKSTLRRALQALREPLQRAGLSPAHLASLNVEDIV